MTMSWTETFDLLGLDLLSAMLLALVALDLLEHAVHQAWAATAERTQALRSSASGATRVNVGSITHV